MKHFSDNGGVAVWHTLRHHQVEQVFGLLGGSMLELYDAIHQRGEIKYIGARDERAATHMADAYARITCQPGIVLGAQAGPGVANLVTGITEAHLAYAPVIAIAGMISQTHLGRDTFQEFDQHSLFTPICKRSMIVPSADRIPELLSDAIDLAMSGRKGPVVIHIPRNLFAEQCVFQGQWVYRRQLASAVADSKTIGAIYHLLTESERPVIFAGGGLKWSQGHCVLQEIAEHFQIPVVTSTGHADLMPTSHPLHAGQSGPRGNRVAKQLTSTADCIFAIGTRLAFNSTFHSDEYINPQAKIIQIDIDAASIGRYFPVELGVSADAAAVLEALRDTVKHRPKTDKAQTWSARYYALKASLNTERAQEAQLDSLPLQPLRVFGEIRNTLKDDTIVTLDTGAMCLQAADRLKHETCPGLITPLDFGLVGFAYAAAIGAAAATPNRPVVCVIGDGGFGMTMSEITTAVQNRLQVIAVVIDNGAWGAEKAYQRDYFERRYLGADLINPDYAEIARQCGADGYCVRYPGETSIFLARALQQRHPAIIHVKVDPMAFHSLRKDLFQGEND